MFCNVFLLQLHSNLLLQFHHKIIANVNVMIAMIVMAVFIKKIELVKNLSIFLLFECQRSALYFYSYQQGTSDHFMHFLLTHAEKTSTLPKKLYNFAYIIIKSYHILHFYQIQSNSY